MKVLHLPVNIASQISISVRALRALGVDARGLVRKTSVTQDYTGIDTVDWFGKPRPISRLLRGIRWRLKMVRAMAWADVLHWHWGDSTWRGIDLRIAAWQKKPRIVEFWGSDLRDPRLASRDNPFLEHMYQQHPELASQQCSRSAQRMFRNSGFECLIPGCELSDYLDPSVFAGYYQTRARLMLDDFVPRFPAAKKPEPLLVHAPSHKTKKGTEAVLKAVKNLSRTHQFNFKLIHDMPRRKALELIAKCDLFLDQFTIGAEGLASLEAMALGKPVVCYIKPSLLARYPAELPIVIADQSALQTTIASLLKDGARRHDLGRQGRQYVEIYHDAREIGSTLVEIYRHLSSKNDGVVDRNATKECCHWQPLRQESEELVIH
jgi:hypothetical protein